MKKAFLFLLVLFFCSICSLNTHAYVMSYEDLYGEPEKSYEEGYSDALEENHLIRYKIREVGLKKYVADHETRFYELWLTLGLTLGFCVLPMLTFRFGILREKLLESTATIISVVYNSSAMLLIGYIVYRIDYLFPCPSVIIIWGIVNKYILCH